MALYAISDLHLSTDNKKSMEVFGDKWNNYMNRIKTNWENVIGDDDYVIVPGDISWATYLNECFDDFKFLNDLPGRKIILKGNHDYWWTTASKLNQFVDNNHFNTIAFLQNNSFVYETYLICGTRGWLNPSQGDFTQEDSKILNREIQRLRISLESGKDKEFSKIIVALHYPPFESDGTVNKQIYELFEEYNVSMCVYGHLHGPSQKDAVEGKIHGIEYRMVSSDYLDFVPIKID